MLRPSMFSRSAGGVPVWIQLKSLADGARGLMQMGE